MKKVTFTIAISLSILFDLFSQSAWQVMPSSVSENLVSVYFTDVMHGFIVSENATFMKTSDGGSNWESSYAWPGIYLNAVFFSDNSHGCSVGWFNNGIADSSLILISDDEGENWMWIDHLKVNRFNDVFFTNENTGWAVGSKGELNTNCIYYTDDGGTTWVDQTGIQIVDGILNSISFRNENQGAVCGDDGIFFITNNGGVNWAMGISMPVLDLNDIFNFGILNGCIVGDEGTALYTTNNWYQYVETITNTAENLNAVSGEPATNKLWAVGDNGTIIYTPNYLFGWSQQESGTSENLNDICMLNENLGWAVGDNGTILVYSPVIGSDASLANFTSIIYPNPASEYLTIMISKEGQEAEVKIQSLYGQLLKDLTLASETGNVDLEDVPPGVYLVTIITQTSKYSTKIIVR